MVIKKCSINYINSKLQGGIVISKVEEHWDDKIIYYVVFKAKIKIGGIEKIEKFSKTLILDPNLDRKQIKNIIHKKLYNIVEIVHIDQLEDCICLKTT